MIKKDTVINAGIQRLTAVTRFRILADATPKLHFVTVFAEAKTRANRLRRPCNFG